MLAENAGTAMHEMAARLYPVCRSMTGDGVRTTLDIIGQTLPLKRHEVASGTPVFDWTVPDEWNIREAWIRTRDGQKIVDFQDHTLHVVGYSRPVRGRFSLDELRPHLHTLPEHPDWIPARTGYYADTWGFCLSQRQYDALPDTDYDVYIDATLAPGTLSYAECVVPGSSSEEVLFYTHICHPSLANDNLSGIVVMTALAERLMKSPGRYTYRFVFAPGTIGSITWLARNPDRLASIRYGLVAVLLGDRGAFTYKRSRDGDRPIDRIVTRVLKEIDTPHRVVDFSPYGYDERQFCSPGINLPVGRLTRTPNAEYPEYHTSGDNLDFITADALAESLNLLERIAHAMENDRTWINTCPFGEPQLGRRGLYAGNGAGEIADLHYAMLWVLNQSDGEHSLLDIADRSGLDFEVLELATRRLADCGLLRLAGGETGA